MEAIVLVAEPRLLGVLRAELTPACADLVEASITKDLDAVPDRDIPSYLETLMASA